VLRLRARRSWVPFPVRARDLIFPKDVQTDPGAHYRASFTLVKQSGHEADHSSSCTDEVKNEWSYISVSPIRPRSVGRDNFTFKFLININVVYVVVNGDTCTTGNLLA
jgi:hypothetical protein